MFAEKVKLLLEHGAEIEARDVHNGIPLHKTAWKNNTEAAKLVLKHGAETEARRVRKRTPLQLAASRKSTEGATLLLEHDAEIGARSLHNRTHLHLAAWKNSAERISITFTRKTLTEMFFEEIVLSTFVSLRNISLLYCTLQSEISIDLLICSGKLVHAEVILL